MITETLQVLESGTRPAAAAPIARAGRYHQLVFQGVAQPARRKHRRRLGLPFSSAVTTQKPRHPNDELIPPEQVRFFARVFELASLDLSKYRLAPLSRRLPACLRALKSHSIDRALAVIEADPSLLRPAVNALLVGVTEFFRDPAVFEHLRQRVLPMLCHGNRGPRVWSVACSNGAELYSVAMLLASLDALGKSTLLGTDCRAAAVNAARAGAYSSDAIADVPPDLLSSHFVQAGHAWVARPTLRQATQWRVADVFADPAPGKWDMILCRNLAIYLDTEAASMLWQKLSDALEVGGFLVVGKADRPRVEGLERVTPCVYRKR